MAQSSEENYRFTVVWSVGVTFGDKTNKPNRAEIWRQALGWERELADGQAPCPRQSACGAKGES